MNQYTPGGSKDVLLVLVGNKVDREEERQVSKREGEAWARQRGMLFIETSAKTRLGIQQVFQELIQKIVDSPMLLDDTRTGRNAAADLTQDHSQNETDSCC